MLRSIDWDKVRVLILATWAVIAFVRWIRKNLRVRGRQDTVHSLVRLGTSILGGSLLTLVAFFLAHWRPESPWAWGIIPGFLIGAITVGVHRDDNLLLYAAAFINVAIYGSTLFVCYPRLFSRLGRQCANS